MTKRFTAKAGHATVRLGEVQRRMIALKAELAGLREEEEQLRDFLLPYYDIGSDIIEYGDREYDVRISEFTKTYLDQDKVKLILHRLGKRVPTKTFTYTRIKVS